MFIEAPSFVIQRRIPRPLQEVQRGLADRGPLAPTRLVALEPGGFLYLDQPFRPVAPFSSRQPTPTWSAPASLLTNRRQVVAKVELTISMWSNDASELQVRPDARFPERWTHRRTRRYFELAHLGADTVARVVVERIMSTENAQEEEGRAQGPRVGSRTTARGGADDIASRTIDRTPSSANTQAPTCAQRIC